MHSADKSPFEIRYDLLDAEVAALEALPDTDEFAFLLDQTAIERTTMLQFSKNIYQQNFREDLPYEFTDKLALPDRVWVHDLDAQLTEFPAADKNSDTESWSLTTSFALSREPGNEISATTYSMTTTPLETVFRTTNLNGDPITRRMSALAGQLLLATMVGSAMVSEASDQANANQIETAIRANRKNAKLSVESIRRSLTELGDRFGTHKVTTLSYVPHPDYGDRAVAVKTTEISESGTDTRMSDFYMNSQVAQGSQTDEAKHTATLSLRLDTVKHDDIVLSALEHHTGKRFPTDVPMDELYFAVSMGMYDSSNEHVFDPKTDRLRYGLIAIALMTVLRPALKNSKMAMPAVLNEQY